jgi:hypothetical protein
MITNPSEERQRRIFFRPVQRQALKFKVETESDPGTRKSGMEKFRRALRKEDQQGLDQLFEKARLHVEAGNSASIPWPFETILISILVEQEKEMVKLRSKIEAKEKLEGETEIPFAGRE